MAATNPVSPAIPPPAGSPASMYLAAFSPRPASPVSFPGSHRASGDPLERLRDEEGVVEASQRSLPDGVDSSPAPGRGWGEDMRSQGGGDADVAGWKGNVAGPTMPSEALSCLPPRRRAQVLLQEMAGLSRRLLDLARTDPGSSGALGLRPKQLSIPQLLPKAVMPPEAANVHTPQDLLQMLQVQQYLLTQAVTELQEIEDIGSHVQEVRSQVQSTNAALKKFALDLYGIREKLSNILEDHKDYVRHSHLRASRMGPKDASKDASTTGTGTDRSAKRAKGSKETGPRDVDVGALLAYSKFISLTTFAPPARAQGLPAPFSLPPCPQEEHFRFSHLYDFSDPASLGIVQVAKEAPPPSTPGAPFTATESAAQVSEAASAAAPAAAPFSPPAPPPGWKPGDPIPMGNLMAGGMPLPPPPPGWKPGDPMVPLNLPPPPPGWKPGDPLPGLPPPVLGDPAAAAAAAPEAHALHPAAPGAAAPGVVAARPAPAVPLRPLLPVLQTIQVGEVTGLDLDGDDDDDEDEYDDDEDEDEEDEAENDV